MKARRRLVGQKQCVAGQEGGENASQDANPMQKVMFKDMSGGLESPDRPLLVIARLPRFRRPSDLTS